MIELPQCRWRGAQTPAGGYRCRSPKVRTGAAGVPAELCAGCVLADHEPAKVAAPPAATPNPAPSAGSCAHRGPAVGMESCPSCTGHVQVKLFACALHGRCHLTTKAIGGAKACIGCADNVPLALPSEPLARQNPAQ